MLISNSFLLCCALLAAVVDNAVSQDSGSVDNCGDASSSKFTLTWSPKKVPIGGKLVLNGDLTASTSLDPQNNNVCYTLWLPDVPDPIVPRQCTSFNCDIIHKVVDFLPCPIKAGETVSKQNYPVTIDSSYPIPTGIFIGKAEIYNANNTMFLCAKLQVEIYSPDDY